MAAPRQRAYLAGTAAQYAKSEGVSLRTAQRRLAAGTVDGAIRVAGRWHVPLTTAQYARAEGVSLRTAQRRASQAGVRAPSPTAPAVLGMLPDLRDYAEKYLPDSWYQVSPDQIFRYNTHLVATFRNTSGEVDYATVSIPADSRLTVKRMIREVFDYLKEIYQVEEVIRIDFLRGYRAG